MSDFRPLWALGLMSGTSLDGVDAALIETDGDSAGAFGPTVFRPYADNERLILRAALAEATQIADRNDRSGMIGLAEEVVTIAHVEVVAQLLAQSPGRAVDVIGFHGQTVFHAPGRGLTVQIGNAAVLRRRFGIPVVHDFRAADVAAGGQGAPLVPVYHRALCRRARLPLPAALINVGGVANVTIVGTGGMVAFDTGPGNALIDDAVQAETGARFDAGGAIAASGSVDEARLATLMAHPYFAAPAPKSLDRDAFRDVDLDGLGFADRVATLTAFTAETVAAGMRLAGQDCLSLVVMGGGARNATLLRMLAERTGLDVRTAGDIGLDVDFVEAQAFACLAVRRLRGLPSTWSGTTGVARPVLCGEML